MSQNTEKNNSEKLKYKFGQNEFDLSEFRKHLGNNVQSYVKSKRWDEETLKQFYESYNKITKGMDESIANNIQRYYSDDVGQLYDSKFNDLSDSDKNFIDFLNIIGNAYVKELKSKTNKKSDKNNYFDITKHGIIPTWLKSHNPAGGDYDMTSFHELDQMDESGKRGTTERTNRLIKWLETYRDQLENYDFSKSTFKTKDDYIKKINNAIQALKDKGYQNTDNADLQASGITLDFLNAYYGNNKSENTLQAQAKEAELKLKQRQEEDQLNSIIKAEEQDRYNREREQYFQNIPELENPFQRTDKLSINYNPEVMDKEAAKQYNIDVTNSDYMDDAVSDYIKLGTLGKMIRGKMQAIRNGKDVTKQHIINNLDWAYGHELIKDKIDGTDYYVVPDSYDYDRWSFIAYNPITKHYQEMSMLYNNMLKEKMAYPEYDRRQKEIDKKEQGGIIKYQIGGTSTYKERLKKYQQESQKEENKKPDKNKIRQKIESGKSEQEAKAEERKPALEGFDAKDKIRLTAAGADIFSAAAAFVPGYGTAASAALGVGSTIANTVADGMDDAVTFWEGAGNLGYGLGMDVVGLIPGFGSVAKAKKIAKVLGTTSKLVLGYFGAQGLYNAKDSLIKLIQNPSELTVEDWQNLSMGFQALIAGGRQHGSIKASKRVNTQLGTPSKYYEITTKSGNKVKVSEEQYDKIKNAKGLEAQNAALKEVNPNEELSNEFINGKFSSVRKIWNDQPKVKSGKEYINNNTTYEQEYIPWGYTSRNGQITPTKYSDAWINNLYSGKDPEFHWFMHKNPDYNKQFNQQISTKKPKTKRTKTDKAKTKRNKIDKAVQKQFDSNPNFEFRKKGGTLNLEKVRKFYSGGISNTKSSANWFDHIYKHNSFMDYINSIDTDEEIENFNNLQKSWRSNLEETGYVPGSKIISSGKNKNVLSRQELYNITGMNNAIATAKNQGLFKYSSNANSGDTEDGGWKDGYFGEQEYLRHFGSEESWKNKNTELLEFQSQLRKRGLEYKLNPETKMYELSKMVNTNSKLPLSVQKELEENEDSLIKDPKGQGGSNNDIVKPKGELLKKPNSKSSILDLIASSYNYFKDLRHNKKQYDLSSKISPLIYDPLEIKTFRESTLDETSEGEKGLAQSMSIAKDLFTSDQAFNASVAREFYNNGLNYKNKKLQEANVIDARNNERAITVDNQNKTNRHVTSQKNSENLHQNNVEQIGSKSGQLRANNDSTTNYVNKLLTIFSPEDNTKSDLAYTKYLQQQAKTNPELFINNLTYGQKDIWNRGIAGESLMPEEKDVFEQLKELVKYSMHQHLLGENNYLQLADTDNLLYNFTPQFLKKGGSLTNSQVKTIIEFLKESNKNYNKAIDRSIKGLYNHIKLQRKK